MKKLILVILYICNNSLSFAQSNDVQSFVVDSTSVTFNKVRPSFDNWSTAQLKVRNQVNNKNFVLTCDVPNYNLRFKTTLSDYCIIETNTKQFKLVNQKEVFAKETLNYTFTFVISKDDLNEIVNNSLKKITFYFVPNERYVEERLATDKLMTEELKRHFVRVSKMTLKYKVSNPDITQFSELKSWLKNK